MSGKQPLRGDNLRHADLDLAARRIRKHVLDMAMSARSGHVGGAFSAAEIFAALYFRIMNIDPARPHWEDRDRFVLSKGHAGIGLYACLAERGYFDPGLLLSFDQIDSILQAHPDMHRTPGIDMSTGSLGQGISAAVGIALGARLLGKDLRVYCMIGDGESQEGQVWEAALSAARFRLDHLTVFLDHNRLQLAGRVIDFMPLEPLREKWHAFGWHVVEIDGHDFDQILAAVDEARRVTGKPTIIMAHTTKGKGVSFMENQVDWHAKFPTPEEYAIAMQELGFGEGGGEP